MRKGCTFPFHQSKLQNTSQIRTYSSNRRFPAMFPKLFTILFTVATAVFAVPFGPAPALVESLVPFSSATANITGEVGVTATNPTMLFYPTANCLSGGVRHTLLDRVFQTCYLPIPNPFTSVKIDNPDGTYLPYTVWVSFTGESCPTGILKIPQSNTCYNLTPTGNGWQRRNDAGGTF
ncbi:hypothetical protein Hypma_003914 [Hypsizygus marmoreus]|uniref:Uncharacterized protein n=1 Tax=Hypsizygus marmoreus TaxID=39966 RepID=A0A369JYS0_HYPMA|nr:hypothetical protein Hypma_003914 [Hypsizygus marmoreus]